MGGWKNVKEAIRENRRGMVRVAEYLIDDDAPKVLLLRSRMAVFEEIPDQYACWRWFVGYAAEFEALPLGSPAPEYDAIFTRHAPAEGVLTLTFYRRQVVAPPRAWSP